MLRQIYALALSAEVVVSAYGGFLANKANEGKKRWRVVIAACCITSAAAALGYSVMYEVPVIGAGWVAGTESPCIQSAVRENRWLLLLVALLLIWSFSLVSFLRGRNKFVLLVVASLTSFGVRLTVLRFAPEAAFFSFHACLILLCLTILFLSHLMSD